jgi:signal transduction histidine kinase
MSEQRFTGGELQASAGAVTPDREVDDHAAPAEATAPTEVAPAIAAQLAKLRHDVALRDEFIATAAHELRNPLSPVYMHLEHLKDTIRSAEQPVSQAWLVAQLDAMTVRFDRFLETLNRLLDASRLGAGHLVLMPDHCDLVEVTRSVLASVDRELRAARCDVELVGPDTVTGWWDWLRLEQIVGNLVSNALRYGAGAPISIRIGVDGDTAQLCVRDLGIGIAAEDLPRIFQRFERARNVGRSTGFGIGLWVVAELCRAMGGAVEIESELDRGTAVSVALPRKA